MFFHLPVLCMGVVPACSMRAVRVPETFGGQKRTPDRLEPELQVAASRHVDARTNQGPLQVQPELFTAEPALHPLLCRFSRLAWSHTRASDCHSQCLYSHKQYLFEYVCADLSLFLFLSLCVCMSLSLSVFPSLSLSHSIVH